MAKREKGRSKKLPGQEDKTARTEKRISKSESAVKKKIIPDKYLDAALIGILVVALFIFFSDAIFTGKAFNVSDNLSSDSFRPFIEKSREQGEFPLWIPYIFSGMPAYASMLLTGFRWWDFASMVPTYTTVFIGDIFSSDAARVLCWYILYGIGVYYLMRSKKMNRFISFFTMTGAVFSTGIIVWIMIGHNTKPVVFAMFPFIFLFLEKIRMKFSLFYSVLLVIAVHIMIEAGHLQMIFYGILAFSIYLIFELISRAVKKQQPVNVLRSAGMLIIAGVFAFLMSSDRYLTTLEYTDYSTRGSAPILKTDDTKITESGGHDYEYATMWSFSPDEIFSFFVPNYFGFGKMKYEGSLTGGREVMVHLYWGEKPFEDAAPYFGIIILFLGVLGAWVFRKDVFVQFLIVLSLFSLFLSFGRHFSLVYDLFYYFIPSFNKFRAPSMALALLHFAMPVLAGYGLSAVLKWRDDTTKKQMKLIIYWLAASAAFLVIGFIFSAGFKTTYLEAVAANPQMAQFPAELREYVFQEMISDWYVTGAVLVLAFTLIYLYIKGKIGQNLFFAVIAFLLVFDLWRVGVRRFEVSEEQHFKKDDVIAFLQNDPDRFRIADFTSATPNMPAYFFLESVNGYHAAKLRVYQDMLDVADQGSTSQVTNPFLWNLLNVKYIITDREAPGMPVVFRSQETNKIVYVNTNMLPRAFFVDSVEKAEPLEILKNMKEGNFNPAEKAFLEKMPPVKIDSAGENAQVDIVEYDNHYIKIKARASGNNLLFLSEIHYPPGWSAYIDGRETEILKTNYAFRSVVVPKGSHTVELKYSSSEFETGKTVSLILNIIVLLSFGFAVYLLKKNKQMNEIL